MRVRVYEFLHDWSTIKVIRLLFGVIMLYIGFDAEEFIPFAIAGVLFYQGIFKVGCDSCCSSGSCNSKK